MPMSEADHERLDVAYYHTQRLVSGFKGNVRKGRDLEKLKLFEQALAALEAARLL